MTTLSIEITTMHVSRITEHFDKTNEDRLLVILINLLLATRGMKDIIPMLDGEAGNDLAVKIKHPLKRLLQILFL